MQITTFQKAVAGMAAAGATTGVATAFSTDEPARDGVSRTDISRAIATSALVSALPALGSGAHSYDMGSGFLRGAGKGAAVVSAFVGSAVLLDAALD